jgi:hypothetical protein
MQRGALYQGMASAVPFECQCQNARQRRRSAAKAFFKAIVTTRLQASPDMKLMSA